MFTAALQVKNSLDDLKEAYNGLADVIYGMPEGTEKGRFLEKLANLEQAIREQDETTANLFEAMDDYFGK